MIRAVRKLIWRFRVWRIRREADALLAADRAALAKARRQHRPTRHILERMKQKRMEAMQ